ncbi:MAG: sulfatase-like hydrolase/transferase [Eubacteriales bacterium]|nr:sulfatase-like hydrolase/transferase [Eubacteriales bacterium]
MDPRPNIIFILSDQQRQDSLSCYHKAPAERFKLTPELDRLAASGSRFNQQISVQPVCGPARACIQTGRYPSEVGAQINEMGLDPELASLAKYLSTAGYETAYVGKWHLASYQAARVPEKRAIFAAHGLGDCIDEAGETTIQALPPELLAELERAGIAPYARDYRMRAIPEAYRGGYRDFWIASDILEFTSHGEGGSMFDAQMEERVFDDYRVDATMDFALEFLRQPHERPFFLFVSFIEPHHQNDRGRVEAPDGMAEFYRDYDLPGDLVGRAGDYESELPAYLACCARIDENVGRLCRTLEDLELMEQSLIFYSSDHACHFRTRNGEYKRSAHDNSTLVPLVIHGPGFEGGHVIDELSALIDFLPTILLAAGLEVPTDLPGKALQNLVQGQCNHEGLLIQISEEGIGRAWRSLNSLYGIEAIFGESDRRVGTYGGDWQGNALASAHWQRYREAYYYDLKQDPDQLTNLINHPEYVDRIAEARQALRAKILEIEGIEVEIEV